MESKLRECFDEMVVYKDLKKSNFFSSLGLPSFLRDWVLKKFEDDEQFIIQVMVRSDEIASIIGKNGVIASSIRNIVNLAAYNEGLSNVKVMIDSF